MSRGTHAAVAVLIVAMLVLAVSVAYGLELGNDTPSAPLPSPLLDEASPAVAFPLLDGSGDVFSADFGAEIAIIHFWSPACAACPAERVALLEVAAAYEDFGVTVVTVLVQGTPTAGRTFLGENGRSPLVADAFDPDSAVSLAFGVGPVPATYFIDRAGVVAGKITGAAGFGLMSATIDTIIVGS